MQDVLPGECFQRLEFGLHDVFEWAESMCHRHIMDEHHVLLCGSFLPVIVFSGKSG